MGPTGINALAVGKFFDPIQQPRRHRFAQSVDAQFLGFNDGSFDSVLNE
jgi:hypothetical protein